MNAADGCFGIMWAIAICIGLLIGMGYLFQFGFIGLVINLVIIYAIYKWIKHGIK